LSSYNAGVRQILILLIACTLPASAQSGSALSDATQFLQTNLGGAACAVYSMGKTQSQLEQYTEGTEATFLNCQMTLETSSTIGDKGSLGSYRVDLGKLDPKINVIPGVQTPTGWLSYGDIPRSGILISTLKKEKIIDATTEPQGGTPERPTTFKTADIAIHVRDAEAAQKLASAFAVAIKACRNESN
jgi:hypothetical protein